MSPSLYCFPNLAMLTLLPVLLLASQALSNLSAGVNSGMYLAALGRCFLKLSRAEARPALERPGEITLVGKPRHEGNL